MSKSNTNKSFHKIDPFYSWNKIKRKKRCEDDERQNGEERRTIVANKQAKDRETKQNKHEQKR